MHAHLINNLAHEHSDDLRRAAAVRRIPRADAPRRRSRLPRLGLRGRPAGSRSPRLALRRA